MIIESYKFNFINLLEKRRNSFPRKRSCLLHCGKSMQRSKCRASSPFPISHPSTSLHSFTKGQNSYVGTFFCASRFSSRQAFWLRQIFVFPNGPECSKLHGSIISSKGRYFGVNQDAWTRLIEFISRFPFMACLM